MEQIKLQLLAKDFVGTKYLPSDDCAISKAVKRTLNLEDGVEEKSNRVVINGTTYDHDRYPPLTFIKDQTIALTDYIEGREFNGDVVIREIVLTPRVEQEETL